MFISQSGSVIKTVVDWSLSGDTVFPALVPIGDLADSNFLDYPNRVRRDPRTRGSHPPIEEIQDGRGLMKVVEEVSRETPVIAIRSDSLSGSYNLDMEAFRSSGVIPCTRSGRASGGR